MGTLRNILRQAIHPSRLNVMVEKVIKRFERTDHDRNLRFLQVNSEPYEAFFSNVDGKLWAEAQEATKQIDRAAQLKLSGLPLHAGALGGGGAVPLLYFLVRILQPKIAVETGVAAGYSTSAILSAIKVNDIGTLYSSDFPYFRLENPERYIGCIVDDNLKHNWKLYVEGDKTNIRSIANSIDRVDLLHYDSDKSYSGRKWVLEKLAPLFTSTTVILMDDIQDNSFFMDYVSGIDRSRWRVFEYKGKFVGMIGKVAGIKGD